MARTPEVGDDPLKRQAKNEPHHRQPGANVDAGGDDIGQNFVLLYCFPQHCGQSQKIDQFPRCQRPPAASQNLQPERTRQIFWSENRAEWRTEKQKDKNGLDDEQRRRAQKPDQALTRRNKLQNQNIRNERKDENEGQVHSG